GPEAPSLTDRSPSRGLSYRPFSSVGSGVTSLFEACRLGEIEHALERPDRARNQRRIDGYLVAAITQALQGPLQSIHRHPGTVRATAACRPAARGRRLDELLVGAQLLHLVEDAAVGGHDELPVGQCLRRLDQLAGGADGIRQ